MPEPEIHQKLDRILLILQGNGNPKEGLVTKHELLTASVAACQKRQVSARKDVRWWALALISASTVLVAWLK